MIRLPAFLCSIALVSATATVHAQEHPEVQRFAQSIKDVIWDLRGTSGLKHLRFDGENIHELRSGDVQGSTYESAFVDVGVVRLNFRGANTGWYFFSDDLKLVTPLTVSGEVQFKLSADAKAKDVRRFPEDIAGAVWESETDERQLRPMKLRWNGSDFEIGVKQGDTWKVDKQKPIVANRRVFEVTAPDGATVWFAFSADGSEAWMLQIENLFGGHARTNPAKAAATVEMTKLTPQLNDLANHAEDLITAGETMRAEAVRRQILRRLAKQPDLSAAIEKRLAVQPR